MGCGETRTWECTEQILIPQAAVAACQFLRTRTKRQLQINVDLESNGISQIWLRDLTEAITLYAAVLNQVHRPLRLLGLILRRLRRPLPPKNTVGKTITVSVHLQALLSIFHSLCTALTSSSISSSSSSSPGSEKSSGSSSNSFSWTSADVPSSSSCEPIANGGKRTRVSLGSGWNDGIYHCVKRTSSSSSSGSSSSWLSFSFPSCEKIKCIIISGGIKIRQMTTHHRATYIIVVIIILVIVVVVFIVLVSIGIVVFFLLREKGKETGRKGQIQGEGYHSYVMHGPKTYVVFILLIIIVAVCFYFIFILFIFVVL